jgi:hypothetical protein
VSREYRGQDLTRREAGGTIMLASDDDRDSAARVLNAAFAEGRLRADEHDERARAVYAARTWDELAQVTADLPDPADATGRQAAATVPGGPDRCLLCAFLILCPPAGIAWLLTARRRADAARHRALAAAGPASPGGGGGADRARGGRRAEDR